VAKLTLSFKDKVLKVYHVEAGEMVIGSDPSCQIHIDSLALQPRHATITTEHRKSVLRDLNTPDGTQVGNKKLTEPHQLKHDEVIRVGKHTLLFTTEPLDELEELPTPIDPDSGSSDLKLVPKTPPKHAWLQLLNGANVGKTISLTRNMTNIGKAGVQTAVITRRDEGFFISHLEGERTPLVDGQAIGDKSWKLEDGNVIQIGNVKMQFTLS
jgi:pSer/pThr/pTyr-binding forkhead associated (FHA) protein